MILLSCMQLSPHEAPQRWPPWPSFAEMLKTQLGKQPSITDTVEYALHQTALKVDSNYQKTSLAVAS